MTAPVPADLARELEANGGKLLWVSREDIEEPGSVGLLVAAPDDLPAVALVLCGDNGLATLLELDVDTANALRAALNEWAVAR